MRKRSNLKKMGATVAIDFIVVPECTIKVSDSGLNFVYVVALITAHHLISFPLKKGIYPMHRVD